MQIKVETAKVVLTKWQLVWCLLIGLATAVASRTQLLTIVVSTITILFTLGALHKLLATLVACVPVKGGNVVVDQALLEYARSECRRGQAIQFTLLVTLFNEGNVAVLRSLIRALDGLEYDKGFVQVVYVIPHKDTVTESALQLAGVSGYGYMTIFRTPPTAFGEPQTKPRDLNYALQIATGDIVCIFDAEDEPHPQQLLAVMGAALRFPKTQAFQCELRYTNVDQNLSTRLAAISYAAYFRYVLPGYVLMNWALPFGGTSNYFRRSAIEAIGGWDSFNITEDANAGILFKLFGFDAVMLFGVETIETPNAGRLFVEVATQWTRWQAGFLVTMLVQVRHPLQMVRLLGPLGTLHVLMIGLTPVFGALIPVQLLLTALRFSPVDVVGQALAAAMEPTLFLAWFSVVVGNILFIVTFIFGGRVVCIRWYKTLHVICAMYVFSIVVGWQALERAFVNPHTWGKTNH